ncbi:DUF4041 domain-containing protein [Psychrobacter sp. FDAARGOS_221]|uniref:DUF4041 domain-containing protein n=1 Tax=Psychrobacter sp. FDAARGOS_221 TaxID=1975705 RepID=UPI000BB56C85|nr:DUF4041 domain-containing protein [Psychrobacter sp. FDAARGOS_221]PNK60252.1 DUF4041 domain-containing protein [Psychrobacter sp. FDAARGOS_221]
MKDKSLAVKVIAVLAILLITIYMPALLVFVVGYLAYQLKKAINELTILRQQHDELVLSHSNLSQKYTEFTNKYSKVIDIDSAADEARQEVLSIKQNIEELQSSYKQKRSVYDDLLNHIAIYDERLEYAEMGMYEPHFDFDTSEAYRDKIKEVRAKQKEMIKEKSAITCSIEWEVSGSKAEGRKMTNRAIRLTARAFNNECDAAIANVTWNNVERMEKRILKAHEAINKMNETNKVVISPYYLQLKLNELRLAYEYKEKRQIEKEEQAELRRQEREEEQLRKEAQRALAEEEKLQALLSKVQEKASHSEGSELERLQAEIAKLGDELKEMQRVHDRVKAMAEQTKLGYVYVISNIGSFGENVYKIGMTRRLEPMDRVKELGDASVPFYFDVHAMIFSEDAPALEAQIQREFADRRLNLVNYRKEYFNVTLDEIKEKVWELNPDVEFIDDIEAREYKESLEIRSKKDRALKQSDMPEHI